VAASHETKAALIKRGLPASTLVLLYLGVQGRPFAVHPTTNRADRSDHGDDQDRQKDGVLD
jgi:hypothetical protein